MLNIEGAERISRSSISSCDMQKPRDSIFESYDRVQYT